MTPLPPLRRFVRVAAVAATLGVLPAACTQPQPPTIPLYRALQVGDLDQIKRHIYYGTPIDSPDLQGDYPLHVAARNGQVTVVRALAEQGARLDVRNAAGRTPLHLALAAGLGDVAKTLFALGAEDRPQDLLFALVQEDNADRDALALLRRRGADLNARNAAGKAPLHLAVASDRVALAKRLILAGADTNLTTAEGQSPLALAERVDDPDLIRLLRQYGAGGPEPETAPAEAGIADTPARP